MRRGHSTEKRMDIERHVKKRTQERENNGHRKTCKEVDKVRETNMTYDEEDTRRRENGHRKTFEEEDTRQRQINIERHVKKRTQDRETNGHGKTCEEEDTRQRNEWT